MDKTYQAGYIDTEFKQTKEALQTPRVINSETQTETVTVTLSRLEGQKRIPKQQERINSSQKWSSIRLSTDF